MVRDYRRYRKIRDKRFLEKIRGGPWECVLSRENDDKKVLEDSCILLKHFNGCFIKADGIICRLEEAKLSPAWSCILLDDGGIHLFTLGDYFNIYLPVKKT